MQKKTKKQNLHISSIPAKQKLYMKIKYWDRLAKTPSSARKPWRKTFTISKKTIFHFKPHVNLFLVISQSKPALNVSYSKSQILTIIRSLLITSRKIETPSRYSYFRINCLETSVQRSWKEFWKTWKSNSFKKEIVSPLNNPTFLAYFAIVIY